MPSPNSEDRRYAVHAGVHTLYKFRAYGTDLQRDWVRQILVESRVYFSRPEELNDPFDLRPRLRISHGTTDAETRADLLRAAEAGWARTEVPEPKREKNRERLRTIPLREFERDATERAHARLKSYWILSLAANRDDIRMWANYADHRRGLCIHFRSDNTSVFGTAQQVDYQNERPWLPVPFDGLSDHEIARRASLSKTLQWAYETEYRVIRYPDVQFEDLELRFDGQHAYFSPSLVTGITVGVRMAERDLHEIVEMARRHDPPITVERPRSIRQ